MKNIYFISDAHLGSLAIAHSRQQERRLVRFLDAIKDKASAVYMLGDMFDFWFEYRMVVPRGYTRFLGKVSELTDNGVEVHFFVGNHDIWCADYLERECGVIVHHGPMTMELSDKIFYIGHVDSPQSNLIAGLLSEKSRVDRNFPAVGRTVHPNDTIPTTP